MQGTLALKAGVLGQSGIASISFYRLLATLLAYHCGGKKEGFHGRECLFSDSQILEDEENNSSLSILAWVCRYPISLIIAQNKVNGDVMAQFLWTGEVYQWSCHFLATCGIHLC